MLRFFGQVGVTTIAVVACSWFLLVEKVARDSPCKRVLVWESDDESPQEARYEIRRNGEVVSYEIVRIKPVK